MLPIKAPITKATAIGATRSLLGFCHAMTTQGVLTFIVGNASIRAKMDLAALVQHALEHLPATLHTRLHARDREPKSFRGFTLGKTLQLYKGDGIAIVSREVVSHRAKTASKFLNGLRPVLIGIEQVYFNGSMNAISVSFSLEGKVGRDFSPPLRRSIIVSNGVARDLVEPGCEAMDTVQCAKALVDSEKDILEDLLSVCLIVHPASDKSAQPVVKFIPNPFRLVSHGLLPHLQPQVAE
jgi:hypothetical protein